MRDQKINVAVSCLISHEGKLLLAQRSRKDCKINGQYLPPSGHIEEYETCEEAIHREVFEETNIKIKNLVQTSIEENINAERIKHSIIICYTAEYKSGEVIGGDDMAEAKFFSRDELKVLNENGRIAKHIVRKLKKEKWL